MGALFGGSPAAAPARTIVTAPTQSSADVTAAADAERARMAAAFGRQSTIIAAPGDSRQPDYKPTLLGAA